MNKPLETEKKFKLVLLARNCDSSCMVYNYLKQFTDFEAVIIEKTISKRKQFMKRVRMLGFFRAAGQVVFMGLINPVLHFFSRKRLKEIREKYSLDLTPLPEENCFFVKSLNSDDARNLLKTIQPDLLIVNGTRIISKKTLESVPAPFINFHVGITPLFRGVQGGYWAIATGRPDMFGVTLHYVDPGVDTGGIIEQIFTVPEKKDNFYTYPYLEYGIALPALRGIVEQFAAGKKPEVKAPVTEESALWFHPTIFQWIKNLGRTMIWLLPSGLIYFIDQISM